MMALVHIQLLVHALFPSRYSRITVASMLPPIFVALDHFKGLHERSGAFQRDGLKSRLIVEAGARYTTRTMTLNGVLL